MDAEESDRIFDDKVIIDGKNVDMNSQNRALRVGGIIFGIVCLAHLWRLFAHIDIQVGTHHFPIWGSVAGAIVAGALSLWMWRLSSARRS
jgi:hypothetical protein